MRSSCWGKSLCSSKMLQLLVRCVPSLDRTSVHISIHTSWVARRGTVGRMVMLTYAGTLQADAAVKLPTFYAEDTAASANEVWQRIHSDPLFAVLSASTACATIAASVYIMPAQHHMCCYLGALMRTRAESNAG